MSRVPLTIETGHRVPFAPLITVLAVVLLVLAHVAIPVACLADSSSAATTLEDCNFYFRCTDPVYQSMRVTTTTPRCRCYNNAGSIFLAASLTCQLNCTSCAAGTNRCGSCQGQYELFSSRNMCLRTCYVSGCDRCYPEDLFRCASCADGFSISSDQRTCTYTGKSSGNGQGDSAVMVSGAPPMQWVIAAVALAAFVVSP